MLAACGHPRPTRGQAPSTHSLGRRYACPGSTLPHSGEESIPLFSLPLFAARTRFGTITLTRPIDRRTAPCLHLHRWKRAKQPMNAYVASLLRTAFVACLSRCNRHATLVIDISRQTRIVFLHLLLHERGRIANGCRLSALGVRCCVDRVPLCPRKPTQQYAAVVSFRRLCNEL